MADNVLNSSLNDDTKLEDRLPEMHFIEFSLSEIEEATQNFDSSLKIGEGGYGSVYKGFLQQTTVAVKILNPKSHQGDIEIDFNQELEILTKLKHPNVVSLMGSCLKARALVYEFLPNGSLESYLTNEETRRKLSWQDRIRIASEVCSALMFLHSMGQHGIAHGDLKPENILLDSRFVSKIIDFGISHELQLTDRTFTPFHLTTNPKYTPAYADPEFFSSCELTPQYDIYSYGIILLQLLTGRGPKKIKELVEEALENGELNTIVDSTADWPKEVANGLALLGLWCGDASRRKRPNLAREVRPEIKSMKDATYKSHLEYSFNEKTKLEGIPTESETLLERATKQLEQLRIERDNAIEERDIALKRFDVMDFTEFNRAELFAATNNFDNSLKIGDGSHSSIYKGDFVRHSTFAIKMLESEDSEALNELNREVEILRNVRHPNIVSIVGVSMDGRAIIYDYRPNASLQTYLSYPKNKKFTWKNRISIASEICSALIYLHSQNIAHGELNPENVLLDNNLVSKLCNFGRAHKLENREDTISPLHQTKKPMFSRLAYKDPEYLSFGELTTQSDVFSFGIILLQFVTGRDPRGLRSFVEQVVDGKRLEKCVDNSAGKCPSGEAMKLAQLGLACSHQMRRRRSNLENDVWPALQSMKQAAP